MKNNFYRNKKKKVNSLSLFVLLFILIFLFVYFHLLLFFYTNYFSIMPIDINDAKDFFYS